MLIKMSTHSLDQFEDFSIIIVIPVSIAIIILVSVLFVIAIIFPEAVLSGWRLCPLAEPLCA